MLPKNKIFQFPSGRWGFVGRVNVNLGWTNKDGTEISEETAKSIAQASNPAMLAKSRSWETRNDALETAKALGLEVTE